MNELSGKNFGLLVAYVLPGFIVLWGVSPFYPTVASWINTSPRNPATAAGLVYVTLASLAVGMVVSAMRWLVVDRLHHMTGVRSAKVEFANLDQRVEGFQVLVEAHYKYYQFYANALVAVALVYVGCLAWGHGSICRDGFSHVGVVLLEAVLLAASRDALKKYYDRVERLLGTLPPEERKTAHDQWNRQGRKTHQGVSGAEDRLDGEGAGDVQTDGD